MMTWSHLKLSAWITCLLLLGMAGATVDAATVTLSVRLGGSGGGSVTSDVGGISCSPTCSASITSGAAVTLSANVSAGGTFYEWRGNACNGSTSPTCPVTLNSPTLVTAVFSKTFTDSTLTPRTTAVKAAHFSELRGAIDTLRSRFGRGAFAWAGGTLSAGSTPVQRIHLVDLRTALGEAYVAAGQTAPTYTVDPTTITAGVTPIQAAHLTELRAFVQSLTISPPLPAALAFLMPPTGAAAGSPMTPPLQVAVVDAFGNLATTATSAVTLALGAGSPPGGTLSGTLTTNAIGGVATFADLGIEKAAAGYQLAASAGSLTGATSGAFTVVAGPPARLTIRAQPTGIVAGAAMTPAVQVAVEDAFGNLVATATDPITLAIAAGSPSGGTLSGTLTQTPAGGIASFAGLSIGKAGAGYQLAVSAASLAGATSDAFDVQVGAAAKVAFGTQPCGVIVGMPFAPPVQVAIVDAFDNLVTTATGSITVWLEANAAGGTLSGTLTQDAAGGIASFANLSIDAAGTGYRLAASASPLAGAVSAVFRVFEVPPEITFLSASQIASGVNDVSGYVDVWYAVRQPSGKPANLVVEYSPDATSPFRRATQAASPLTPGYLGRNYTFEGVEGVYTAPSGGWHHFLWDVAADLPGLLETKTGRVRVGAQVGDGPIGPSMTYGSLWLRTGLNFHDSIFVNLPQGTSPRAVVIGDWNRDGKLDLATANTNETGSVSILLGDGAGNFAEPTSVTVGKYLIAIAAGDFNRDGKLDLVVPKTESDDISILIGDGAGGFSVATSIPVGDYPTCVAVGDLNGDGKLDIAVGNASPGDPLSRNVMVLLGDGAGGFSPATSIGSADGPYVIVIGDLNGDAKPDIVTANQYGGDGISIFFGDGTGSFPSRLGLFSGQARDVAIGDFNLDGKADLAVVSGTVAVLMGDGAGGFAEPVRYTITDPWGYWNSTVKVGDLDGDGKPDIAVGRGMGIGLLIGDGTGAFTTQLYQGGGWNPDNIGLGDMNGDGKLDIVSLTSFDSVVFNQNFMARGDRRFGAARVVGVGETPRAAVIGHLNLDAKPDLVVANEASNDVSVFLADGGGGFVSAGRFATGAAPQSVAIGDLNGDTLPDLVTANRDSGNVSVLLGDWSGGFQPKADFAAGAQPIGVTIGRFDADGTQDLVVRLADSNHVVLYGDGNGGFSAPAAYTGPALDPPSGPIGDVNGDGQPDSAILGAPSSHSVSVELGDGEGGVISPKVFPSGESTFAAIGDLNREGKTDLAIASQGTNDLSILIGDGAGGFSAPTSRGVGTAPRAVAIGDLNGDGRLDLVTANPGSNDVSVLLALGDGSFSFAQSYPAHTGAHSIAMGDLNRDGTFDLAVAYANGVSILLGNGSGGFSAPASLNAGTSEHGGLALGDLDRDGKLDLAVAIPDTNKVWVFLGDGSGGFGDPFGVATGTAPRAVAVGDLDRDGRLDLAVANAGSKDVSVLFGNGTGGFSAPVVIPLAGVPVFITTADLDQDGKLDIVVCNDGVVSVLRGDGAGGFLSTIDLAAGPGLLQVAIGDLNGDGKPDIAVAKGTNEVAVIQAK